jgi:hypothetical protein
MSVRRARTAAARTLSRVLIYPTTHANITPAFPSFMKVMLAFLARSSAVDLHSSTLPQVLATGIQIPLSFRYDKNLGLLDKTRTADPHHVKADPDPSCHLIADAVGSGYQKPRTELIKLGGKTIGTS